MPRSIQDADIKSAADLIAAGATAASLPNDTKVYVTAKGINDTLANAITNGLIGSGSGGGINYITNPDFETNATGYAAYLNTAQSKPVTGTGGTPTVTLARSIVTPLRGTASGLFTKPASNTQGQGFSYAFTIADADKAKVLQISFDYLVKSGTFTAGGPGIDSDLEVYIYDVTNSQLIQPSTYKLFSNSTSVAGSFIGSFQTSSNSNSYRLILHCATTSALAYTLEFDNIYVSPTSYSYGTVITDWVDYVPATTQGLGNITIKKVRSRRVGGNQEINATFDVGSSTAIEARFGLNGVISADTTLIPLSPAPIIAGSAAMCGRVARNASNGAYDVNVLIEPSTAYVTFGFSDVNNNGLQKRAASVLFASSETITFDASIPIQGWAVQQQTSDINDQRIVSASYKADTSGSAISPTVPANYNVKIFDSHSAVTTSSTAWQFTAPVSGTYFIAISALTVAAANIAIYKNGTFYLNIFTQSPSQGGSAGSTSIQLNAGDYIDIRSPQSTNLSTVADWNSIHIERVANPSTISATETISAVYTATSVTTSPGAVLVYGTKVLDTHGAMSGGVFTAPAAGLYLANWTGTSIARQVLYHLRKNGTTYASGLYTVGANAAAQGSTIVRLNAGQTLDVINGNGSGELTSAIATDNIFSIIRIGL